MEKDLVFNSENLLGKFHTIVAFIVANESGSYSHPLLRETALLTLCRMMCVSSLLCDMYLPLLFTTLERSRLSAEARTTLIIAIGDLSFRFPNSLEPWTAHVYRR